MSADLSLLRAAVARLLRCDPADIDPEASLTDLGLDSLRLMKLTLDLEAQGLTLDYGAVLEQPTLIGIWRAAGGDPGAA